MITHLKPDILECEVKWALGSITMNKYSGGNELLLDLFQILKDDAVKVLPSMCQQNWKTQQWPENWNRSFFIPIQKKGNAKQCSNYHIIAFISHARKAMLKCLQAGFNSMWNCELPHIQARLRKGRGTRDQISTSSGSWKSKRVPAKHPLLLYWLCHSLWLWGSQQIVENS